MKKVNKFIQILSQNRLKLILIVSFFIILSQLVFFAIYHLLGLPFGNTLLLNDDKSIVHVIINFLIICLFAPFFETFILQKILYKLIHDYMNQSNSFYIISVAIVFGLFHYKPYWTSIPIALYVGFLFNYLYVLLLEVKTKNQAFLIIFLIHSLVNLFAYSLKFIIVFLIQPYS